MAAMDETWSKYVLKKSAKMYICTTPRYSITMTTIAIDHIDFCFKVN